MQRNGLDEQGRFGMQCIYPYLSTYRDIESMHDFEAKARSGEAGFTTSRASVYEYLLGTRLRKEFSHLSWSISEALDMIDRLVRVASRASGQVDLAFDLDGCVKAIDAIWGERSVDAGVSGTDEQRRREVCEKTFQSALFNRNESGGAWIFADRGTRDLFLARWLNGEIARTPSTDCSIIGKHPDLLAAPGVVRFFAGQPLGQRCLAHVAAGLCSRSDQPSDHVSLLDQGLPIGTARSQPLAEARAVASTLQPKACVAAVLDALDATLAQ